MAYKIFYYADEAGKCQVLNFLNNQDKRFNAKAHAWIEQLKTLGPLLPRPYADYIGRGIYELRVKYGQNYRILYFFILKDNIVLSNAFIKKGRLVPEKEKKKAQQNKADVLSRIARGKLTLC
ncbi:type II toxin-antitoxin system RelE/ParE family toxin [candidate division FCPU426 bacterium]|nr:type II toxin-antitoxin system RelE/ParE family toxin [candidate division FCPU426 bacterium]